MNEKVFADYAKYYDLLYAEKDYKAEAEYFSGLIEKHSNKSKKSLLEFGAGTGRHQEHFRNLGYTIQGIELSEEMVQLSAHYSGDVSLGDMRDYEGSKKYDCVLALFHVMSYMTTIDELISAFSTARKHLDKGGLFLFDYWFEEAVLGQQPQPRMKHVTSDSLEVIRFAAPVSYPTQKIVEVHYTMFGRSSSELCWRMNSEVHRMRYFATPEIIKAAESTGFNCIGFEETISGLKPSSSTWGVTAIVEAI